MSSKISSTPRVFIVKNFEDVEDCVNCLEQIHSIIVNLSSLEISNRYRIVDFLSGYIYARKGYREKLESNIYMFSL